jgi:hypothetical protein
VLGRHLSVPALSWTASRLDQRHISSYAHIHTRRCPNCTYFHFFSLPAFFLNGQRTHLIAALAWAWTWRSWGIFTHSYLAFIGFGNEGVIVCKISLGTCFGLLDPSQASFLHSYMISLPLSRYRGHIPREQLEADFLSNHYLCAFSTRQWQRLHMRLCFQITAACPSPSGNSLRKVTRTPAGYTRTDIGCGL